MTREDYVIYNKNKRDVFFIMEEATEDEVYIQICKLDMSKTWVYYSFNYLYKQHTTLCGIDGLENEFCSADDIKNNERGFQEVLDQMDSHSERQIEKGA
jgi:hypothetical protein